MHSLFSRRFDESRSVLLISTDQFISTIVEDALYEWRYNLHVTVDPTKSLQELHLHRSKIVILDLESLDLLDPELSDIVAQGVAESSSRIVHIERSNDLKSRSLDNRRPDAVLRKPFDCMLLRKSIEPDWQPPRVGTSTPACPVAIKTSSTLGNILKMPHVIRVQADIHNQLRVPRKAHGVCRKRLDFKKRSA